MEPQPNVPETSPMLIAVPQLWVNLTPEHHHRLLGPDPDLPGTPASTPGGPQCEVPHD